MLLRNTRIAYREKIPTPMNRYRAGSKWISQLRFTRNRVED